jgi:titin
MINTASKVASFHSLIDPNTTAPAAPPALATPSSLVATPVSTVQINLTWADGANDYLAFLVGRSTDQTKWTEKDSGSNLSYYSDTSVSPNTLYYYRVRAYYQDPASKLWSYSAFSNIASARTKRR